MFSRIDESVDKIRLPYYDPEKNEYRYFYPDFVFWMCRGREYRIVLVDPKGTTHINAQHKIDGYRELFEENGAAREFSYQTPYGKDWKVSLHLYLYSEKNASSQAYKRHWIKSPREIFCAK